MTRGLEGIEKAALELGIRKVRGEDHRSVRWHIKCSACATDQECNWGAAIAPDAMAQNLRRRGWSVNAGKPPVCKSCQQKEHKVKPNAPGPDPKIARRIYNLLEEHFHEETKRYRTGWDDARIASEIGTALMLVERIRREAYGELAVDPAVAALKDDLDMLRLEWDEAITNLGKAYVAKMASLEARLSQLAPARK